ncbi:hypothetical protein XENORESO_002180 [Xenotaenia resolanae]|uniref:Uncharacterized protein n=1 Tax=Xenotaenia resolanae TaxID=208358 RepID=A0ABV0WI47_9TELE
MRVLPGQSWCSHVTLYTNGHGNAATVNVAQLLCYSNAVAEVESQASVLCTKQQPNKISDQCFLCLLTLTETRHCIPENIACRKCYVGVFKHNKYWDSDNVMAFKNGDIEG